MLDVNSEETRLQIALDLVEVRTLVLHCMHTARKEDFIHGILQICSRTTYRR
jgi:hypothetical protein